MKTLFFSFKIIVFLLSPIFMSLNIFRVNFTTCSNVRLNAMTDEDIHGAVIQNADKFIHWIA